MTKLMIYGATGYTGRMVAEHATRAGTPVVLGGRSEKPLADLAAKLGVEYRVFALDDDALIDRSLTDVAVMVNAAGPFLRTAKPMMEASIRNGVHYIDTAAELDSYRLAEQLGSCRRDASAGRRGQRGDVGKPCRSCGREGQESP